MSKEDFITKRYISMCEKCNYFQKKFKGNSLFIGAGMEGEYVWRGPDYIKDVEACFRLVDPLTDIKIEQEKNEEGYITNMVWIPTMNTFIFYKYIIPSEFFEIINKELFIDKYIFNEETEEYELKKVNYWEQFNNNFNELGLAYVMYKKEHKIWDFKDEVWKVLQGDIK